MGATTNNVPYHNLERTAAEATGDAVADPEGALLRPPPPPPVFKYPMKMQ